MQHRHGRRQHPCRVGGRKPTTAAEHPTTLVTRPDLRRTKGRRCRVQQAAGPPYVSYNLTLFTLYTQGPDMR